MIALAPTDARSVDAAIEDVRRHKDEWAQLPVRARIDILKRCLAGYLRTAEDVVAASCRAKGHEPGSVESGEEWMSGPVAVIRQIRLFIESLSDIERTGRPHVPRGAVHRTPTGELAVRVFPRSWFDRVMYPGSSIDVWMQQGVDESNLQDSIGAPYRSSPRPGKVVLVLGAGNVASIAPNDALYKLVVEQAVVVLKMHPVNAYLGPLLERAFEALIAPGYLRIVYGDAAEGQYLVHHAGVDEVHMTGSTAVHDRIVWGDTPEEQTRRRAARTPKVAKRVTSELGCVTPTIVVPGRWSDAELHYQAENIATMVAHGASCTCVAAKMLVTWRSWPQRQIFLDRISEVLARLRPRLAYYPGAARRYAAFTAAYPQARRLGAAPAGSFACATVYDLPDNDPQTLAFREEAWSPVLAETALDAGTESGFLEKAVRFCNERIFGTLSAGVIVSIGSREALGPSFDRAISELHYGTVAVNHWSAMNFVLGVAPWGAYPGHTREDVGSGIGVVHNTLMFNRPLKTVVWGPFVAKPKPPWFVTHRRGHRVGRHIARFEASPSMWKLPAIAWNAIAGSGERQ